MSRRFKIERDCYEDENYLYKKGHVTFQPGLTVLVGCNGCGKTTLMKQLENILKKDRKKSKGVSLRKRNPWRAFVNAGSNVLRRYVLCGSKCHVK